MAEWDAPGYTRLKELGSGGFGDVVLARHDVSGTLVAIKYLRQNLLSDAEFTEMFRAEASVLSTLDDPNVFVKPWTVSRGFALRTDMAKVDEFVCEHNPDYSKLLQKK